MSPSGSSIGYTLVLNAPFLKFGLVTAKPAAGHVGSGSGNGRELVAFETKRTVVNGQMTLSLSMSVPPLTTIGEYTLGLYLVLDDQTIVEFSAADLAALNMTSSITIAPA